MKPQVLHTSRSLSSPPGGTHFTNDGGIWGGAPAQGAGVRDEDDDHEEDDAGPAAARGFILCRQGLRWPPISLEGGGDTSNAADIVVVV